MHLLSFRLGSLLLFLVSCSHSRLNRSPGKSRSLVARPCCCKCCNLLYYVVTCPRACFGAFRRWLGSGACCCKCCCKCCKQLSRATSSRMLRLGSGRSYRYYFLFVIECIGMLSVIRLLFVFILFRLSHFLFQQLDWVAFCAGLL